MRNKIKILSATIISISIAASAFTACNQDNTKETVTNPQSEKVSATHSPDYTYNTIIITTQEDETEFVHIVPPVPTEKTNNKTEAQTQKTSLSAIENTTKKAASGEKVDELSNGLYIVTKTTPVTKGNSATVVIQGTPDAEYTIEFYESASKKASYEGLNKIKADSSGFAAWTFTIEDSCESGERKIIIKEKNSDKFIQTSITVQ